MVGVPKVQGCSDNVREVVCQCLDYSKHSNEALSCDLWFLLQNLTRKGYCPWFWDCSVKKEGLHGVRQEARLMVQIRIPRALENYGRP